MQSERRLRRRVDRTADRSRLTGLQCRVVSAIAERGGSIGHHDLAKAIWPPATSAKAWRYSSNGGPPGWAMSLGRVLGQLHRAGITQESGRTPGTRRVMLVCGSVAEAGRQQ